MITFSIIIPVYNAQLYLKECLDSILEQTYKKFEIIVVDDGSEDNSMAIVNEYKLKSQHVRFFILQQKHKNAGAARNIGMKYAKGDYLLFLDADDKVSPILLEEIVSAVGGEVKEDIVLWDGAAFDNKTKKIQNIDYLLNFFNIPKADYIYPLDHSEFLYQFTAGVVWNKVFSNRFIKQNNLKFQEIDRANDIFFTFIAISIANSIRIIEKRLVFYRCNNDKSLQGNKGQSVDFYKALMEVKRELLKRNIYIKYKNSFSNICLVHCINELNSRNNGDDFAFIYRCLKEYIFENLELKEMDQKKCYFLSYYMTLNKIINKSLEAFLYDEIMYTSNCLTKENHEKIWPFPFDRITPGTKVVLYGAGNVGRDFEKQIKETYYCKLVLWVDREYTEYRKRGMEVNSPYEINNIEYEIIILAVRDKKVRNDIIQFLIMMGVNKKKILL